MSPCLCLTANFCDAMRLAFVIDSFMIGGSELAALRTLRLLQSDNQMSVIHFHSDGPLLREYEASGVEMYHVPLHGVSSPKNIGAILSLRRLLSRLDPDVIHSHDAYSNMIVLAAQWPAFRRPWISSRRWLDQIVRPLHARLNHTAFLRSSAVAVNSDAVGRHMVEAEGVPAGRVVVIPNFVDVPAKVIRDSNGQAGTITIGMVSRVTPIKRHDIAVRAVRKLLDDGLDVRLVIIGDGEALSPLRALITKLGLSDSVLLEGEKRGGPALQQDFDISLATSDSEGSPNSVLEAMAAGRPVVATDVGGTRDLIRQDLDGLLVRAGDVDAVTTALRDLVINPERRRIMGESGRSRALAEFSPHAITTRLTALYTAVVQPRAVIHA